MEQLDTPKFLRDLANKVENKELFFKEFHNKPVEERMEWKDGEVTIARELLLKSWELTMKFISKKDVIGIKT